jgi:hypothetical protein
MKRFLSIFLAVSLFFNSGFIFSGAEASAVPVPLTIYGNGNIFTDDQLIFEHDTFRFYDPTARLERLTALEALIGSFILQASLPVDVKGLDNSLQTGYTDLVRQEINKINEPIERGPYIKVYIYGDEDKELIQEHLKDINLNLDRTKERIKDLKALLGAFLTQVPLDYPVSGVANDINSGDANEVRQELWRARAYKKELVVIKNYWEDLSENVKDVPTISNLSTTRGKSGDIITVNGSNLGALKAVIFSGTVYNGGSPSIKGTFALINDKEVKITIPEIPDLSNISKGVIYFIGIEGVNYISDFTYSQNNCPIPPICLPASGCTYSNPPKDANGCVTGCGTLSCSENSCICPPGKVFFRDKCYLFNVSRVKCAPISAPVCGCDGVTYTNKCEAQKIGLKNFTSGACH